jgi:hypothetical protein
MALPPLYKYLNVNGAKLTLGNRTFRHAKPSNFNDIEDMTIGSIFPEETEGALKRLSEGFGEVILPGRPNLRTEDGGYYRAVAGNVPGQTGRRCCGSGGN